MTGANEKLIKQTGRHYDEMSTWSVMKIISLEALKHMDASHNESMKII